MGIHGLLEGQLYFLYAFHTIKIGGGKSNPGFLTSFIFSFGDKKKCISAIFDCKEFFLEYFWPVPFMLQ
jgi:hypothetical protein